MIKFVQVEQRIESTLLGIEAFSAKEVMEFLCPKPSCPTKSLGKN